MKAQVIQIRTSLFLRFSAVMVAACLTIAATEARADEYQTLNAGWLLETARNTVLTNEPWVSAGCDAQINGGPSDMAVYRDGRLEVVGVLERTPNSLRDVGAVSVEVLVDGELYMRFDPSPYLEVTLTTFKTSRDIDRGEILSGSDVAETTVDVRTLPIGELFNSLDEIVGMAARMNVQSGRILHHDLLEPPTVVERGDVVLVAIPIGGAEITLNGIALDSGAVGDEIRVRNPDSGTIITAIVTGPSRAEIHLAI